MTHDHDRDGDDHDHEHDEGRMVDGPLPGMRVVENESTMPWIQPLDAPEWMPGRNAEQMRADDFVLGIIVEGQAYALPWWVMKNHHIANLTIGDTKLLVALCENCSSAC